MTDSLKKPDIFFFNSVRLKRDVSKKKHSGIFLTATLLSFLLAQGV